MSYCALLSVSDMLVSFGLFVLVGDRVCRIQNMLINIKEVQPKIESYLYLYLLVCRCVHGAELRSWEAKEMWSCGLQPPSKEDDSGAA